MLWIIRLLASLTASALLGLSQTNLGELRLSVSDPNGLPVATPVVLTSIVNQYNRTFNSDSQGHISARRLSFGIYSVTVNQTGFAAFSSTVEVRSALPKEVSIKLALGEVKTRITVNSDPTLIDPYATSSSNHIGKNEIADRLVSQPGRGLADLINQEPGWMFEANGILHPRAEEYQVQYVIDGIPLTENRSVAYLGDFDPANVQSLSELLAGFPAEYGRKLGGVIEVETTRDKRTGFHARSTLGGGSYNALNGFLEGQYGAGATTMTVSISSAITDRFLDPPATENFSNHGNTSDFMAHYERDLGDRDRIGIIVSRQQSKFLVPDEIPQQQAGQRQDRQNFGSSTQLSYQHVFSANLVGNFNAMTRDLTARYWSNNLSAPIIAAQGRGYHEEYAKATGSAHFGLQELKFGGEADFAQIEEALSYSITNPAQFSSGTPLAFAYYTHAMDREQSAFVQDELHWRHFAFNAGLRFDHYDLLLRQKAWSPRLGLAYYVPKLMTNLHASYDRVFQTPAFENLLVSSSPAVSSLDPLVVRLPVQPARANYYEAGFTQAWFGRVRVTGNFFRRSYHNYPDDDLLLNTGISFPIAIARANVYGEEAKLELPHWGHFSGYASWTNERGNGYFPVTGGLFLGDNAAQAIQQTSGVFAVTQEQRNAVRARLRYNVTSRFWLTFGGTYDSGLPIDFGGTKEEALAEGYSPSIVNRVNFSDQRPRPLWSLSSSVGMLLKRGDRFNSRFQVDAANLTDSVNVLNFAGLFSGTAVAVGRSVSARLSLEF